MGCLCFIFSLLFDIDEDGKLSKDEYTDYIKAIGAWGTGHYSEEEWDSDLEDTTDNIKSNKFNSVEDDRKAGLDMVRQDEDAHNVQLSSSVSSADDDIDEDETKENMYFNHRMIFQHENTKLTIVNLFSF